MATADSWAPSEALRTAAAAERRRLGAELATLVDRRERLETEVAQVDGARRAVEEQLRLLDQLGATPDAGPSQAPKVAQLRVVGRSSELDAPQVLKGARIREIAVRLLLEDGPPDRAVHYRAWFGLMRQRGYLPAGKDPLATFLTQINRSPVIRRSTAPGMYSVDTEVIRRMRASLEALVSERDAHQAPSHDEGLIEITQTQQQLSRLGREITKLEAALAEADRSVGQAG